MSPKRNLTDEDIRVLTNLFPTKDEVREIVKEQVGALPTKEEFANKMDELMGEVKAEREENDIISGKVSDHEERIGNLESSAAVA